jgi:hypothetical protein
MAGMPTRQLTLSHAATDSSETPATAFAGTGLGAGLNAIIDDAKGTAVKVGSGASSPSRGKVLVGSGQVDADSNQQSIWVPYQGKNLIANGTGRTKQRTTMPTTDNSYAIDRMRLLMEQTNGWTISQETSTLPTAPGAQYGFRFTVGAGSAGKGGGFWPVVAADMAEVAGGVLSLQANIYISNARLTNMRIGIAQFTGTADASTPASLALAATTFGAKYAENVAISSSAKNVAMLVWCDGRSINAADFFIVTDIQCERSAVCTSVERVPEPIERVLALAWYEEFGGDNSAEPFDQAQCFSTTQAIAVVSYFPKRIAPAFSMSAATDFSITQSNASTTALTTLTLGVASKRRASLVATVGSAVLAAGNASRLAANTTNARLQFSSEP